MCSIDPTQNHPTSAACQSQAGVSSEAESQVALSAKAGHIGTRIAGAAQGPECGDDREVPSFLV